MLIHSNVRAIRKAKGISASFVANALGLTRQGYHYLETGRSEFKAEMLRVVSTALDVQVEVFFDDKLTKSVIRKLKRSVERSAGLAKRSKGA